MPTGTTGTTVQHLCIIIIHVHVHNVHVFTVHVLLRVYMYMYMYMHMYMYIAIYMHVYTCTCTCMCKCVCYFVCTLYVQRMHYCSLVHMHMCSLFMPHSEISSSLPDPMGCEGVDGNEVAAAVESFTQPTRYDELVISTQVPCTPGASEVLTLTESLCTAYILVYTCTY